MIFGPGWAMLLSVVQVVFLGRAPYTKKTVRFFVKLWVPIKGTQ